MKKYIFLLLILVVTSSCSSSDVTGTYARVKDGVYNQFNRYNYRSNMNTYKPQSQPASWRKPSTRYTNNLRGERRENWKNYKVGRPYKIAGRWYYPEEDPNYSETGMASWYGPKFHNKTTANGEIFDRHLMTAAHRTLPMPSIVKVTNLNNKKVIWVRVNDRGPFAKDRIIDLSERAAHELGFRKQGTARVRVEFDRKATEALFYDPWDADEETAPKVVKARHVTSPRGRTIDERVEYYREHYVQAGSYSTWDSARSVARGLKKVAPVYITEGDYRGDIVYRVQLGPFETEKQAGKVMDEVAMMGFDDAIVLGSK